MELDDLRKRVAGEEFDYQMLMDVLRAYDRPRDKIRTLLKKKSIIRVKKGLYVFGETLARRPFSREVLANLIYGPSYISLDYALHYHGLIPERVETITSCTTCRGRAFSTPVGRFSYRQIPAAAYALGIDQVKIDQDRSFLIALPEKALADKLYADRGSAIGSLADLKTYLVRHLRIDLAELAGMKADLLARIATAYRSRKIRWLSLLVRPPEKGKSHDQ
jgi:predicted transcriptional regulator of viral defense system